MKKNTIIWIITLFISILIILYSLHNFYVMNAIVEAQNKGFTDGYKECYNIFSNIK